jgi:hypothetical protein
MLLPQRSSAGKGPSDTRQSLDHRPVAHCDLVVITGSRKQTNTAISHP